MNAKDKHDSDVATCRACLLSDRMKPCKNGCHCQFEVGLVTESVPNLAAWVKETAAQMADALDWMQQTNELRAG